MGHGRGCREDSLSLLVTFEPRLVGSGALSGASGSASDLGQGLVHPAALG